MCLRQRSTRKKANRSKDFFSENLNTCLGAILMGESVALNNARI